MKTVKRDVPGHFCDSARCNFWMHTDILEDSADDAYGEALYCISLIGEYQEGWNMLNISRLTYELAVFDKKSESPWLEVDGFRTSDKDEAIKKFKEAVNKYKTLAEAMEAA